MSQDLTGVPAYDPQFVARKYLQDASWKRVAKAYRRWTEVRGTVVTRLVHLSSPGASHTLDMAEAILRTREAIDYVEHVLEVSKPSQLSARSLDGFANVLETAGVHLSEYDGAAATASKHADAVNNQLDAAFEALCYMSIGLYPVDRAEQLVQEVHTKANEATQVISKRRKAVDRAKLRAIKEIEAARDRINAASEIAANDAQRSEYATLATKADQDYEYWRKTTIGIILTLAIGVVARILWADKTAIASDQTIALGAFSVVALTLANYTATLSHRQEQLARLMRQRELDLNTIPQMIAMLPDEQQAAMRQALIGRLMSATPGDLGPAPSIGVVNALKSAGNRSGT